MGKSIPALFFSCCHGAKKNLLWQNTLIQLRGLKQGTKFQAKGLRKLWGLAKGPIFWKGIPPKVEEGNWVQRNKLWGMGTFNKPKKHPNQHDHLTLNKRKNIQTNMIIKHWTNEKTSKPTWSLNIEQTKITSKPTWSLNIQQTKKHPNQHDH